MNDTIKIQYVGPKPHTVMYDNQEVIFECNDIKGIPGHVARFLLRKFPENLDSANVKGAFFREIKEEPTPEPAPEPLPEPTPEPEQIPEPEPEGSIDDGVQKEAEEEKTEEKKVKPKKKAEKKKAKKKAAKKKK